MPASAPSSSGVFIRNASQGADRHTSGAVEGLHKRRKGWQAYRGETGLYSRCLQCPVTRTLGRDELEEENKGCPKESGQENKWYGRRGPFAAPTPDGSAQRWGGARALCGRR